VSFVAVIIRDVEGGLVQCDQVVRSSNQGMTDSLDVLELIVVLSRLEDLNNRVGAEGFS